MHCFGLVPFLFCLTNLDDLLFEIYKSKFLKTLNILSIFCVNFFFGIGIVSGIENQLLYFSTSLIKTFLSYTSYDNCTDIDFCETFKDNNQLVRKEIGIKVKYTSI